MSLETLRNPKQLGPAQIAKERVKHPFPGYQIVTYDFEYVSIDGERPKPVCLVWQEWESGETHRVWQDELLKMKKPPFDISEKTICCTYYYGAEGSCHQALGWDHPAQVIDCFAEFRSLTNA